MQCDVVLCDMPSRVVQQYEDMKPLAVQMMAMA